MTNKNIIQWIVKNEDLVVPTLFKPVQFRIIKKLSKNKKLTENEKRYLRGKMKDKFNVLQELMKVNVMRDEFRVLVDNIGSYYVTGLEALKHNGYGWYFEPKIVEVINTKIEGRFVVNNKTVKFIRVKSISKSKTKIDKKSGIIYATNEQILKDIVFTKNNYTESVWMQMFSRYGMMFAKGFKELLSKKSKINYALYGV